MRFIKAKFLKDGKPMGRSYTYKTADDVIAGDIVKNVNGTKLMVLDEPVNEEWLKTYGTENVAVVEKVIEVESEEKNGSRKQK